MGPVTRPWQWSVRRDDTRPFQTKWLRNDCVLLFFPFCWLWQSSVQTWETLGCGASTWDQPSTSDHAWRAGRLCKLGAASLATWEQETKPHAFELLSWWRVCLSCYRLRYQHLEAQRGRAVPAQHPRGSALVWASCSHVLYAKKVLEDVFSRSAFWWL